MPGPSADDRLRPAPAAEGPADRLSLTVSVLLIGGLLLATAAIHQNVRIDRPMPRKPLPDRAVPQAAPMPAARQAGDAVTVIRLPPPPAAPTRARPGPVPRPATKPRSVEPLKRTVAVRPATPAPAAQPAPGARARITPLAPAPAPAPPVARPPPASKPAPPSPPVAAAVDGAQNAKAGGALLRLLEHGQGPTIEIAWPQRAAARRSLYRQLTRCYGVRPALLSGGDRLYADAGGAGESWTLDRDRFSGFIRSPQGEVIAEETRVSARIAARHGLIDGRPVRVFPRDVDAALLGGLGAVLGPDYKSARQIRAAYRWDPARLILENFTVDGRPLDGTVVLPVPHGTAPAPGCD